MGKRLKPIFKAASGVVFADRRVEHPFQHQDHIVKPAELGIKLARWGLSCGSGASRLISDLRWSVSSFILDWI